ncbi:MAG: glutaminase [Bacteroides sp.]|nr:glutaminase [Bacteroides sp.]
MNYQQIIDKIYNEVKPLFGNGKVADYIPALANVNPKQFGIAIATTDGKVYGTGDYQTKFSIQSISKVFTLTMVMHHYDEELWECVGREPSGSPFNSLVQLEYEHGIPRNPFINAGALVITDRLMNLYPRPKESILNFIREMADSPDIYFDQSVARSELECADRNMALGYFMKSFGNIDNAMESLIDVYCNQCSVTMTCEELAKSFMYLVNHGVNPYTGQRILSVSKSKRLNALMLTCGFYDESGDFAFRVGMPGKSGVGGGIVAIIPGKLSIAVWSPELDKHGNSYMGIETLERFTTDIGKSIF